MMPKTPSDFWLFGPPKSVGFLISQNPTDFCPPKIRRIFGIPKSDGFWTTKNPTDFGGLKSLVPKLADCPSSFQAPCGWPMVDWQLAGAQILLVLGHDAGMLVSRVSGVGPQP